MKSFFKWVMKFIKWIAILIGIFFLGIFLFFILGSLFIQRIEHPSYVKTKSALQNQATEMLLEYKIHTLKTKQELQKIADLGVEAVPVVMDGLFGRGNFKGREEPWYSLLILGLMKDSSVLPALKYFLIEQHETELFNRKVFIHDNRNDFLVLRVMLELKNDDETRAYVADAINKRIAKNNKYDHLSSDFVSNFVGSNIRQSLENEIFVPLPDKDVIDICTRVHLDEYGEVYEVYKALANQTSEAAINVLRFYSNKNSQQQELVQKAVGEALTYYQQQLALLEQQLNPPKSEDYATGLEYVYLDMKPEKWIAYREALINLYKQKIHTLNSSF